MSEPTIHIIPLYEEESSKNVSADPPAIIPEAPEEKKQPLEDKSSDTAVKSTKKFTKPFINIISGNIFTKEEIVRHLPYVLFLAFIALLYIANGYYAEDTVRKLNKAGTELKELRSEYITTKSELMNISKQSEVAKISDQKIPGLKESLVPPKKIVVKN